MCHRLSRDQPQPGSFFQRPREAEKRDPGNEVGIKGEHSFDDKGLFGRRFQAFFPRNISSKSDLIAGHEDSKKRQYFIN